MEANKANIYTLISELYEPFVEVQEKLKNFHKIIKPVTKFLEIAESIFNSEVFKLVNEIYEKLPVTINNIIEKNSAISLLGELNWLPHKSTPFGILNSKNTSRDSMDCEISKYYEENWMEVKESLLKALENSNFDKNKMSFFLDAIDAHEARIYRAVPMLVFAGIEKLNRSEILDKVIAKKETSVPTLKEIAFNVPVSVSVESREDFSILIKIKNELYKSFNSEEELEALRTSEIPNRHAVMHGYVEYNSLKSSINSLIIADFVVSLISRLKSSIFLD